MKQILNVSEDVCDCYYCPYKIIDFNFKIMKKLF